MTDTQPGLDAEHAEHAELEAALRRAVREDEFALAFQPEFDLDSMRITAVEALLRWTHPTLGELSPRWFIGTAERSDLIQTVGAWVIDRSVAQLSRWIAELGPIPLVLRVNVSPVQVAGGDVVAVVAAALDTYGVPGHQLCVELTESARSTDVASVADTLDRLKALGVTSAIDDIATGYNTLSYLRSVPFDLMKLDRSLVTGLDRDARARAIVRTLIELAHRLGMGVTGEGVETSAELRTLRRLGCTRAQGHYLARPTDRAGMLRRLQSGGNTLVQ